MIQDLLGHVGATTCRSYPLFRQYGGGDIVHFLSLVLKLAVSGSAQIPSHKDFS